MRRLPVIVLGAGGHAKVLIDMLRLSDIVILGVTDAQSSKHGSTFSGLRVIGGDDMVLQHKPDHIRLVNGVGSTSLPQARRALFERFKQRGYSFHSVIHPSAVIAVDTELAEGVNIMAGAIIQPGSRIGANAIVNTAASVDHDCVIGAHVHLAPGVILSGGVCIGEGTHVGTGACVIQGVAIGENCVIGAGALVLENVPDSVTVMGAPAKRVR